LILVRDLTRAHIDGAPAGTGGDELLAQVDARYDELSLAARKKGKDLFDRAGKRFAKKVRKALEKDREPPQPAGADMPTQD